VISSGAYRIGPFEVESALLEHPAVLESAVVGSPDADRGNIVKAFVVLRPGHEAGEALVKELQEHCKRVTARTNIRARSSSSPSCPRRGRARFGAWSCARPSCARKARPPPAATSRTAP